MDRLSRYRRYCLFALIAAGLHAGALALLTLLWPASSSPTSSPEVRYQVLRLPPEHPAPTPTPSASRHQVPRVEPPTRAPPRMAVPPPPAPAPPGVVVTGPPFLERAAPELPAPLGLAPPLSLRREARPGKLERVVRGPATPLAPSMEELERAADDPAEQALALALTPRGRARPSTRLADAVALKPRPGGGYRYDSGAFNAEIFPDGTVVFYDPPPIRSDGLDLLGVAVDELARGEVGILEALRNAVTEAEAQARHGQPGVESAGDHSTDAIIQRVLDNARVPFAMVANFSFSFDLTESAMRAVGEDPYLGAKRCFMEETAHLRGSLRRAHAAEVEAVALTQLRSHLCEVWADEERAPAQRRRTLFELWDECDDTALGDEARAVIVEFVREQLPAGSLLAFSVDELQLLNRARQSVARFAPY